MRGPARVTQPVLECTRHPVPQRWTPTLVDALVAPHDQVTMDVRIAVGLIRFSLDWDLEATRIALAARGIELSLACLSNLSDEFLIRWNLFLEDTRPAWAPRLKRGFVLMIDATHVNGGPATVRAVDARTGVTILSQCIPSENEDDLVVFLQDVKRLVGKPRRILRDGGSAIKAACARVFPNVAQQLCHFHYLREAGKALLTGSYDALKKAVVETKELPALQRIADALAHTVPHESGVRRALGVFARLLIEHVVSARDSVGGFPFRLAYHEAAARVRDARAWAAKAVTSAMRLNVHHPLLVEARQRLDALGQDADVRPAFLRVERLWSWFLEVRDLMRLERGFNDGNEPPVLTPSDRDAVLKRVHEIRGEAARAGPAESAAWEGLVERFREHEHELWVFLDAKGVPRTTNQIEGYHRDDRRGIRKRTGQGATNAGMERVGEYLALWSNARNPWFVKRVLSGVDLAKAFLSQDRARVAAGLAALRAKRWRGRLPVRAQDRKGLLEEFVRLMDSGSEAAGLDAWAARVEGVAATGV